MTRFFSFERACLFGFKSAPRWLPWSIAAVFGTLLARYGVTYINRKLMFCTLGQWTCPNFRANGVYRGKGTEQCKFGSVKACKKEKELTSGWCASLKNAFASASYSFILMHLSMLCRRGGKAGRGDLTFFKNLQSNPLPTGKSFQSNATKFPHPGLHIALSNIPRLDPRKAQ